MSQEVHRPGSFAATFNKQGPLEDIRWEISQASLELVASREALERRGIRIEEGLQDVSQRLDDIDRTVTKGVITLHADLMAIEGSVHDLSARFEWGMTRVADAIGGMRDSLQELLRLAKTPEHTWACEQFDIARDALRRGLVPEALEHIERAINGYQSHPGHKLDHRFHQLLGDVRRMPNVADAPPTQDLSKAKQAYLNASRYAGKETKADAALALFNVAQLCFNVDKDPVEAEKRLRSALEHEDFQSANYYLAKVLLHQHKTGEAPPYLLKVLRAAPTVKETEYALKVLDIKDPDLFAHEDVVRGVIANERDVLVTRSRGLADAAADFTNIVEARSRDLVAEATATLQDFKKDNTLALNQRLQDLRPLISRMTLAAHVQYLDAYDAESLGPALATALDRLNGERKSLGKTISRSIEVELDHARQKAHDAVLANAGDDGVKAWFVGLGLGALLLGTMIGVFYYFKSFGSGLYDFLAFLSIIGILFSLIVALTLPAVMKQSLAPKFAARRRIQAVEEGKKTEMAKRATLAALTTQLADIDAELTDASKTLLKHWQRASEGANW